MPRGSHGLTSAFQSLIPDGRHAHVDGLRAIAVVAVVLFHAGLPGFSGGFVGVDVFFVISGYLILTQIIIALESGRFSLMDFWARRVMRIVPALLVVVVATFIAGYFLLHSHRELEVMTLSSGTASLFISNIYFFIKQGYFDTDSWAKPLLHTWSLGVEQQFYFLAPLLLMPVYRRFDNPHRAVMWLAVCLFVSTLALTIWLTPDDVDARNAPFYLTPFRAWAFIFGAAAAYGAWRLSNTARSMPKPGWIGALASLSGLALIIGAVVFIPDTARHPGWVAIIPVLGTTLAIFGGLAAPYSLMNRALSLRPVVFVGIISYGWYLWHWPLISLGQINAFGTISLERNLIMAGLSFCLAIASWILIERAAIEFWRAKPKPRPALRLVLQSLAVTCILAGIIGAIGVWRYADARQQVAIQGQDTLLADLPGRVCADPAACGITGRGMLIGDSHADRLETALKAFGDDQGVLVDRVEHPLAPEHRDGDFVIVSTRLAYAMQSGKGVREQAAQLQKLVTRLSDGGRRRILLFAPVVDFDKPVPECPLRAEAKGLGWDHCALPRESVDVYRKAAIETMRAITEHTPNTRLLDTINVFCDAETCRSWVDRSLLYTDTNHLSSFGSRYIISHYAVDFLWALTGRDAPSVDEPPHQ